MCKLCRTKNESKDVVEAVDCLPGHNIRLAATLRSPDQGVANEGDTVTLSGQFTDPGPLNPLTVTIDWGDGTTPTVLYGLFNEISAATTPGQYTFAAPHQFQSSGSYSINVSVSDSAITAAASIPITVNNVAPGSGSRAPTEVRARST